MKSDASDVPGFETIGRHCQVDGRLTEHAHGRQMPVAGGQHECRPAVGIARVDALAGVEHGLERGGVPVLRGDEPGARHRSTSDAAGISG